MNTRYEEQGVVFDSGANRLVGIATVPEVASDTGVLILVGGPQYRVGSHRQFTQLARSLAKSGVASFRFDFSGTGDSEGDRREFDETLTDISAAIDVFLERVSGITNIVVWGLCDAASSAMIYAHQDSRVSGLILLNPWVHSGEYSPEVKLSHFYRPFLSSKEKWRHLVSDGSKILPTLREMGGDAMALVKSRSQRASHGATQHLFVTRMLEGLERFQRGVLVVLSENDLTASEFSSLVASDPEWKAVVGRPSIKLSVVAAADHTFSKKVWKDEVSRLTIEWIKNQLPPG